MRSVWPWLSVCAVIAVIVGSGTSFAPLYLDNWGGDTRHYMCPFLGGRDAAVRAVFAGMCVTPLPWYAIVTVLCALLAVMYAVFCEMAMRLDSMGNMRVRGAMSKSGWRARGVAAAWAVAGLLAMIVLTVLTREIWLPVVWTVGVALVWIQASWHVISRIRVSLNGVMSNGVLAAAWGFIVTLMTQRLVCFHITLSGGVTGAVMAACVAWAICSVVDDIAGAASSVNRRAMTTQGVIAFIIAWAVAYYGGNIPGADSSKRISTQLCPQFSVTETGARIASCSSDGLIPLLSSVELALAVIALPLGACAAISCHCGKKILARILYGLAGLCVGVSFVIGRTLA